MKFYSGFSLKNEEYLFSEFIKKSEYTICGFSYGAIKALKATQEALAKSNRVDTLQLFSPAFFQSKDEKFKRLQLMSYKKNQEIYLKQFISSCFAPYENKIVEHTENTIDELQELLEYEWNPDDFKELIERGVTIEVYLGGKDRIIDVNAAKELFLEVSTVTYIKAANHFLQLN
ncbi:MAG: pimelyl-ACP methyl ester esterase BioV [Sulfurimonas sp.]|nr:pimelyl-ACP methyl ester esterase BioV [Sulfurimonas sp.]